jgi:hypothetical protein
MHTVLTAGWGVAALQQAVNSAQPGPCGGHLGAEAFDHSGASTDAALGGLGRATLVEAKGDAEGEAEASLLVITTPAGERGTLLQALQPPH